jgi:hypothetical protein
MQLNIIALYEVNRNRILAQSLLLCVDGSQGCAQSRDLIKNGNVKQRKEARFIVNVAFEVGKLTRNM